MRAHTLACCMMQGVSKAGSQAPALLHAPQDKLVLMQSLGLDVGALEQLMRIFCALLHDCHSRRAPRLAARCTQVIIAFRAGLSSA